MARSTPARAFLDEDFLLEGETARLLYHDHAAKMPIFDYHCHLPPEQIASDTRFASLTSAWLAGDHYKWRAMRANGIDEERITGGADDRDKFRAWAETVPRTVGNPLYQWTHLELRRYFGIEELLSPRSADAVYERSAALLAEPGRSARGLVVSMNVKVVCTTDDPTDSLPHHERIRREGTFPVKVLPAFRPDRAHAIEDPASFAEWAGRLEGAAGRPLPRLSDFLEALSARHDFFHAAGGRLSDHGIDMPVCEEAGAGELEEIYRKARSGVRPEPSEVAKFRTRLLLELGRMDSAAGWTMQLHMGAIRGVNSRMRARIGRDAGFDAIGDFPVASSLARFLDRLASEGSLPKTILYCVNPSDYDLLVSLVGCFQEGPEPGKLQFGSAWWFNDQRDGILRQLTALANNGLLSRFVGMLTDSRSFLSYPRHEYFRRILCSLLGGWADRGEAPRDEGLLSGMVEDLCFRNAARYFGIETGEGR